MTTATKLYELTFGGHFGRLIRRKRSSYKSQLPPLWLLFGSPILMDPHTRQKHARIQHDV